MLEYKYHPPVYHFYNHKNQQINKSSIPEMLQSINHRITTIDLKIREHLLNDLMPKPLKNTVKPSFTDCIVLKKILEKTLKHYKNEYKNLTREKIGNNDFNRRANLIAYNINKLEIKILDKKIIIHTPDKTILNMVKKLKPKKYEVVEI